MPQNKTMLNMIVEERYHLIAIHCSHESYKAAFLLNKHLRLRLKRERRDLDFKHKELVAFYPLFHYFDQMNCSDYYMVSNKFDGTSDLHQSSEGDLFSEKATLTKHLMSEYKNVDYFLKIEDETQIISAKKLIDDLNKIPQILTAYEVDVETLRSQENLIFN